MSREVYEDGYDDPFEKAIEDGWINPIDQTKALIDVMNERDRQHNEEHWTPEHDDRHSAGELAAAGACYAGFSDAYPNRGEPPEFWPFDDAWWKPSDYRRDLVKAAALILAEIERLDRAESAT